VAAAVESFYPFLSEDELAVVALRALEPASRRKLAAADRVHLKRLASVDVGRPRDSALAAAVAGIHSNRRLASIYHMHCNRLGLNGEAEARATALLRALILSRASVRAASSRDVPS
jgi:hypothetical protein